jgi:peptidyl-prolyl cis-trans isomerase C
MRKNLSATALPLLCAALLLAGCAAGTASVKSEPLPVAAKETPAAKETAAKPPEAATAVAVSPDDPVARIDSTTISRKELDRALSVLVAQNRIQPGSTPEALKNAQKAALEQLVFAELIYQQGTKVAPADLEKQVELKMAQNKERFGSPAEFESALKDSGVTEKELAEISRKDIVITNFIETKISPTIAVTDDEIKKFYDDNRASLVEEPQVKASHILIGVDASAEPAVKAEAKAKAEAILKELKGGKNFAEAAKANSTCPSKEQGGDLGFFGKGQMVPPFEQAAFSMKPGELNEVVETQFGYHIIKITETKESEPPKLDELKEKISAYLKGQKTQKAVFDYVTKLRKEAKVEILL